VRRLIVGGLIVMDMLRSVRMEPLLYQFVYLADPSPPAKA
jgi:hypothetical protein